MIIRYLLSISFFIAILIASTYLASRLSKKGFLLNLPFGFSILISVETIFFNLLSVFDSLNVYTVLLINLLYLYLVIHFMIKTNTYNEFRKQLYFSFSFTFRNKYFIAIIPLLLILLISSLFYPPNTWDSMTYHLGRVIHWIDNSSISYYDTNIKRQILFPPGAEYLILFLQLLSNGDYFAPFVQYLSYFIIVVTIPRVIREFGVKKYSNWAYIFVATIPMAILQSTSTYNDLVSSVVTLSVAFYLIKELKNFKKKSLTINEIILLSIAVNASYMVKPTSLLVLIPFILIFIIKIILTFLKNTSTIKLFSKWLLVFLLCSIMVSLPETIRRYNFLGGDWTKIAQEYGIGGVYDSSVDFHTRLPNIYNNLSYHKIPIFNDFLKFDSNQVTEIFHINEGHIGNGIHLQIFLLSIVYYFLMFIYLSKYQKMILPLLIISWGALHWYVPWMPWNSRLQTPFFILSILLFILYELKTKSLYQRIVHRVHLALFSILLIIGFSYSFQVAIQNNIRPFNFGAFFDNWNRDNSYYVWLPDLKKIDDSILKVAAENKIKKIGFYCNEDSYDYPLSVRANRIGIKIEHILNIDSNINKYKLIYSIRGIDGNTMFVPNNIGLYKTKDALKLNFSQIFTFNSLVGNTPYSEESIDLPIKINDNSVVRLKIQPKENLVDTNRAFIILFDKSNWQNSLLFENNIFGNNIVLQKQTPYPLYNPRIIYRNWHNNPKNIVSSIQVKMDVFESYSNDTILFSHIEEIGEVKSGSPYFDILKDIEIKAKKNDIIILNIKPSTKIAFENKAFIILFDPVDWQKFLIFQDNISGIEINLQKKLPFDINKLHLIIRNWQSNPKYVIPPTKIQIIIKRKLEI